MMSILAKIKRDPRIAKLRDCSEIHDIMWGISNSILAVRELLASEDEITDSQMNLVAKNISMGNTMEMETIDRVKQRVLDNKGSAAICLHETNDMLTGAFTGISTRQNQLINASMQSALELIDEQCDKMNGWIPKVEAVRSHVNGEAFYRFQGQRPVNPLQMFQCYFYEDNPEVMSHLTHAALLATIKRTTAFFEKWLFSPRHINAIHSYNIAVKDFIEGKDSTFEIEEVPFPKEIARGSEGVIFGEISRSRRVVRLDELDRSASSRTSPRPVNPSEIIDATLDLLRVLTTMHQNLNPIKPLLAETINLITQRVQMTPEIYSKSRCSSSEKQPWSKATDDIGDMYNVVIYGNLEMFNSIARYLVALDKSFPLIMNYCLMERQT